MRRMERCDTLEGTGWSFRYDDALFPPGTDSFLLSAFPRLHREERVCDLGCGVGLLGLLLLRREPTLRVVGVEQEAAALALAERNAAENGLSGSLRFAQGDLRSPGALAPGSFDLAVANPPYFPSGSGPAAADARLRLARTEERLLPGGAVRRGGAAAAAGAGGCAWSTGRTGWRTLLCALRESRGGGQAAAAGGAQVPARRPPSVLLAGGPEPRAAAPDWSWEPPLVLYRGPDGDARRRRWTPSIFRQRRTLRCERNAVSGGHPHRQPGGLLPPGGGHAAERGLHRRGGYPGDR
jgi:SAM-dependent methyltransferase